MWNAGSVPARMIEVISPAGFERFFRELTDMTAVGAPDPADVVALADRYELPFAEPDWLPDVITRYGLADAAPGHEVRAAKGGAAALTGRPIRVPPREQHLESAWIARAAMMIAAKTSRRHLAASAARRGGRWLGRARSLRARHDIAPPARTSADRGPRAADALG